MYPHDTGRDTSLSSRLIKLTANELMFMIFIFVLSIILYHISKVMIKIYENDIFSFLFSNNTFYI
jgi:hypothetical protein